MEFKKNKPFLKWAGNKFRLLRHIIPLLPPAKRLVEPFAGSAALFLNTDYIEHVLAEKNQDLIHLYRFLQEEGPAFIRDCAAFFTEKYNQKAAFYTLRATFNTTQDLRLRAILFLYLNRHGYNGLCRYNRNAHFNVPFGRYTAPYFPERELLEFYHQSHNAQLIISDFSDTFATLQAGDLVYCDPPYAPLSLTARFSQYTPHGFDITMHETLAEQARSAQKKGCHVLVSNHDTPYTRSLYHDAEIISFTVRRTISRQIEQRGLAHELIAIFKP